jgi:hypothetical protein
MFSSFNALQSANPGSINSLMNSTCTPTTPGLIPTATLSVGSVVKRSKSFSENINSSGDSIRVPISPTGNDCNFQSSRPDRVLKRTLIKFDPGSNVGGMQRSYDSEPNGFSLSTTRPIASSVSVRGANRDSSETIFSSSASIFDCCARLIPSSKTNRQTVQSASTATPETTSHIAMRWINEEYLGLSSSIPAPTAIDASTLADISTTWGQNGSAVPESNALTYVSILAVAGWGFASGLAIWRLISAVRAYLRDRRHRARES